MFNSDVLDVAIGIVFVFALTSIICTAIREGLEAWLKTRAAYLEYGIRELLHDKEANGLASSFFNHPLIYSLFPGGYSPRTYKKSSAKPKKAKVPGANATPAGANATPAGANATPAGANATPAGANATPTGANATPTGANATPTGATSKPPGILARGDNLPSYIPANLFALVLMDIAVRGPATDAVSSDPNAPVLSLDSIRANLLNVQNPSVQRVLLIALDSAQGDINKAQANIEAWYNGAMDRVSGWYKRSTHWIILVVGLVIAIGFNIDTITIARYLSRNDAARAAMVKAAQTAVSDPNSKNLDDKAAIKQLGGLNLPIGRPPGWDVPAKPGESWIVWVWINFFAHIPGWLLTALATTMGAPFWFDVLNKIMVIRSTVKPHEKSLEEASE
ncbi:MAG: hypothetical protein JWN14_4117, partial [Chthonomonadales bacterium]|nr:hypothetical protein [Chthonomonadales bacterium]